MNIYKVECGNITRAVEASIPEEALHIFCEVFGIKKTGWQREQISVIYISELISKNNIKYS